MNRFAVLKQSKFWGFLALKWVLVLELPFSSEGQRWFQSCSHSHTAKHTEVKHTTLLYMLTPSQDCVKHTHTQICYISTLAPFRII